MRTHHRLGIALIGLLVGGSYIFAQPPERPRGFLGVVVDPDQVDKVLVRDLAPDSPAAKAGLKAGDVIKKIEGKDLKSIQDFFQAMAGHKPGDKINFVIERDGKAQDFSATLAERPQREGAQPPPERRTPPPAVTFPRARGAYLGIHMQPAEKGVQVTEVAPDSPAAKAGFKTGDVITGVGDKATASPEELQRAIQESGAGKEVAVQVLRGNEKLAIKATLGEAPVGSRLGEFIPRVRERFPNVDVPPVFEGGRRVQELEKKIESLEKRIAELEKRLEKKP